MYLYLLQRLVNFMDKKIPRQCGIRCYSLGFFLPPPIATPSVMVGT